jgi:diacylglycerol diphosphate phosphatase / phosphatidate phosphatase
MSSFLTHVFKNAIGRARPDLIARCMPEKGTPAHDLVTYHVCTQINSYKLNDGWRSFPSGHSSFAFSGLGYFALVLAGQLHTFRPRTDLARVLITITPLIGAFLVAASRTADYRHDIYDVTAGSLLGFGMAYFGYRRYYGSIWHPQCHAPYPSPAEEKSEERRLFSPKRTDEEAPLRAESFDLNDLTDEEDESQPLAAGKKGKQRQDSR